VIHIVEHQPNQQGVITMKKLDSRNQRDLTAFKSSKRAKLRALLFTAEMIGTTLVLGAGVGSKIPIADSE
jgi:hypothetical protein